jgi:sialidase-1
MPPHTADGKGFWILSNAADPSARVRMTVRLSDDEGRTWRTSRVIYPNSSAYSSLTVLTSGDLGLLFEMDNYGRISFVKSSLAAIQ